MNTLRLRRETVRELSGPELSEVAGAASIGTHTCITVGPTIACVSVDRCLTGYCTWSLAC